MKVNIVARPDHSLLMYKQFINVKQESDCINLYTFSALKEGSLENILFPKLKVAPSTAITLNAFTLISRLSGILLKRIGGNSQENNLRLFELLAPSKKIIKCDVLHYWPFYCVNMVRNIKKNTNLRTVAEYYEAEPSFVNAIFDEEYQKFGLAHQKRINKMIDQNASFQFEQNFIVASKFTKHSYQMLYPDKNYHVCSYGPLGYQLDLKSKVKEISSQAKIVFVGQVCLEKGVHYLIDAIKDLGVTLDLIGPIRAGQEHIFLPLIDSCGRVTHLGPKRHSEVLETLSSYSLFCLPSLSDNYSLAVVEGLSKKIPVIVTNNCGNADDITNFNLGYVAQVKSSESLRECILSAIEEFDYKKFERGLSEFFSDEHQKVYPKSVLDIYRKLYKEKEHEVEK